MENEVIYTIKQKIKCPHCNYENTQAMYIKDAVCKGVFLKCKKCKKEFEIIIKST